MHATQKTNQCTQCTSILHVHTNIDACLYTYTMSIPGLLRSMVPICTEHPPTEHARRLRVSRVEEPHRQRRLAQRVQVSFWYIHRPQSRNVGNTLSPRYIPRTYMDPLGWRSGDMGSCSVQQGVVGFNNSKGSKYPIFEVSGPKSHTRNGTRG